MHHRDSLKLVPVEESPLMPSLDAPLEAGAKNIIDAASEVIIRWSIQARMNRDYSLGNDQNVIMTTCGHSINWDNW